LTLNSDCGRSYVEASSMLPSCSTCPLSPVRHTVHRVHRSAHRRDHQRRNCVDEVETPALCLSTHASIVSSLGLYNRCLVCLSVCLSRSCIVSKRQKIIKISTRCLFRKTSACLSQIVLRLSLHRSIPSSRNFFPK